MRNLFSWRIKPSEAEFSDLWENATFVFDTNFLLGLYRVSRFTAEDYLNNILEHIQDRVWLPHQVASEFFDNREDVIQKEAESFQKALSELEKWKVEQQSFNRLRGCLSQAGRIVSSEVECLFNDQKIYFDSIEQVEKSFREKIEQLSKDHASLNSYEDRILEKLLLLFDTKVGNPFPEKDLVSLHEEADTRYQRSQAPGFMDAKDKKDERKYGDFILWKQILDFAKEEAKPIIFVTGEKKDDWWIKRNGKPVSPREDLRREFLEITQQAFWMYQTQDFLELVGQRLKIKIDQRSINETIAIADLESVDETDDETLKQALEQIQIFECGTQSPEQISVNALTQNLSSTMQMIKQSNELAMPNLAKAFVEQSNLTKVLAERISGSNLAKAFAEQSNLTKILAEQISGSNLVKAFVEQSNLTKILAEQISGSNLAKAFAEQSNFDKILAEKSNFDKILAEKSNFDKILAEKSNFDKILAEKSNFDKILAEKSNFDKILADQVSINNKQKLATIQNQVQDQQFDDEHKPQLIQNEEKLI